MANASNPSLNAAATTPALAAYHANRPLMWRNLGFILFLNLGWAISFTVVGPLMQLRVNTMGLGPEGIGIVSSINSWAYSFLVMYFAWKSDHTVSRFGRRIPYLFISAPVIIGAVCLFPHVQILWLLVALWLLQMLFTDIKAATIPLLNIDCMPRRLLARAGAPAAILTAAVSFFALRYGMRLTEEADWLPYTVGAAILALTTLVGGFAIKEPPVHNPTTEKFRPWSAMKVAWQDPRKIVQMMAVAMLQTFQVVFSSWIWLFSINQLGLTRPEVAEAISWAILCGAAAAFPVSWLVDRISPYRLMPIFCGLVLLVLWSFLHIRDVNGLILTTCLQAMVTPFYNAADIMVYRTSPPEKMGSITSTNSCMRGFYNGCIAASMGWLIHATGGNYHYAYLAGAILTLAGLGPLFVYRWMLRRELAGLPGAIETSNMQHRAPTG